MAGRIRAPMSICPFMRPVRARIRLQRGSDCPDDFGQDLRCRFKGALTSRVEVCDLTRERIDPAFSAFHQESFSSRSSGETDTAAVGLVAPPGYEHLSFKGVDDARHGWWPHLFGGGEVAEAEWSAEDDDGERGEAWGVEAAAFVFAAEFAEEMDGGGMKFVGEFIWIGSEFI